MKVLNGYKLVLFYLGTFMIMIGCIILLPLVILPFYPEEINEAHYFLIPGIITIFLGYIIRYFLKGSKESNLEKHQDSVLVTLIWMLTILCSAFPWMLTGKYNFTQAIFECTSGYTTTGLSVVNPDTTSHIFLFFRSVMLFVGGIGLVLVLSCAISDRYGMRLWNAEGHPDKLMPNLKKSAKTILSIYSTYILLGTIAYCIAGMSVFDALNHSISALSTGGFSTRTDNIMYYDSVAIDIISDVLMLLGGTNFVVHLYLFRGQIKNIFKHCEVRFLAVFGVITTLAMTFILYKSQNFDYTFGKSLNIAAFQFISAITTTGFNNAPIMGLPVAFSFIMTILMIIGAGIGSTGGGMKQYRFIASMKGIWYNLKEKMFMKKTVSTHYISRTGNIEELTKEEISETHSFVLIYLTIFFIGSLIFTLYGNSLEASMFEFASALGTVGISMGITGYSAPVGILWTATFGMFVGRLEILVVFNALARVKHDALKERW